MSQQHTRCPSCSAVYPMPSDKLANPNAKAKCGRCQQVFLLNDNLIQTSLPKPVSKPALAQEAPATQAPAVSPKTQAKPQPAPVAQQAEDEDDFGDFLDAQIKIATTTIQSEKMADSIEDSPWVQDALKNSDPTRVAINHSNNAHANPKADVDLSTLIAPASNLGRKKMPSFKKATSHKPTTQQLQTKKSFVSQLMWFIGCLMLLGLMVVQYTLFNLESLIANPAHASKIQAVCSVLRCSTPNADLGSIGIHAKHENQQGATHITITITNRSAQEQLYPDLLVRLKNAEGAVVGDFVAKRSDYLAESQKSILGNQQKRVRLSTTPKQTPTVVEVTPLYQSP